MTVTLRPPGSKSAFAHFGLNNNILRAIAEAGFEEPRPIQNKTIPAALQGRDVLGLAQTGTGKTAAFALPIIERLVANRGQNPRALILAPTRELAIQTHAEIGVLAKYTNVRAVTVFGGVNAVSQVRALRAKPHIIVACPGRLLDLMGSGDVRLEGIEVLVLDEADHMLDMGFLPDIRRILARLPAPRQNLLFSATMPREIRSLTDQVLREPHVVELAHAAPLETIEHVLYPVEHTGKTALLRHLLGGDDFASAIVFLRTKHRARRLAKDLDQAGHHAIALQGNMSQSQRQVAMDGFRSGRYDVLVATDIAARGIDVAQVSHVINFDVPNTPDAYTHRIGRTGRAERNGKAYTFVTRDDHKQLQAIERKLNMKIPRVHLRGSQVATDDAASRQDLDAGRPPRPSAGPRKDFRGTRSGPRSSGRFARGGPRENPSSTDRPRREPARPARGGTRGPATGRGESPDYNRGGDQGRAAAQGGNSQPGRSGNGKPAWKPRPKGGGKARWNGRPQSDSQHGSERRPSSGANHEGDGRPPRSGGTRGPSTGSRPGVSKFGGSGGARTGGKPASGGRAWTGGKPASGGRPGTGGKPASSGRPRTGGKPASGGRPRTGGKPGRGGGRRG